MTCVKHRFNTDIRFLTKMDVQLTISGYDTQIWKHMILCECLDQTWTGCQLQIKLSQYLAAAIAKYIILSYTHKKSYLKDILQIYKTQTNAAQNFIDFDRFCSEGHFSVSFLDEIDNFPMKASRLFVKIFSRRCRAT